jgi:hypothetical protein
LRAVIPYLGGELEAVLEGERWTVRRSGAERSSVYLDFALAELLDEGRLAAGSFAGGPAD